MTIETTSAKNNESEYIKARIVATLAIMGAVAALAYGIFTGANNSSEINHNTENTPELISESLDL